MALTFQGSQAKVITRPRIIYLQIFEVFVCFLHFIWCKTKPFKLLEIGLMPLEMINFGPRNFGLRGSHVLSMC